MRDRRDILKALAGLSGAAVMGNAGISTSLASIPVSPPRITGVEYITPHMEAAYFLDNSANKSVQVTPQLRALCHSRHSVAQMVQWIRETGQAFAVRSSGHSLAGFSQHDELVLDLRRLNHVKVNRANATVTVGAGCWSGPVYSELAKHQFALAGGTVLTVAMAGLTLGGGLGYLSRSEGLLCDRLRSIEMVDANGRIVRADAEENADLFWASRGGGGGSFGIATEMTFSVTPVNELHYLNLHISVPSKAAARIIYDWQDWVRQMGRETTTHLMFSKYSRQNTVLISLTGMSTLPRERLLKGLRDLAGTASGVHDNSVLSASYEKMIQRAYNWFPNISPQHFDSTCDVVGADMSKDAVDEMIDVLLRHPVNAVKVVFESLGGAVSDIDRSATAFPHREAEYVIYYLVQFFHPSQVKPRKAALVDLRDKLRPHVTGGAYVNYPDVSLENWAEAYWGENLSRLKQIKRKWDPENIFHHAQSIPVD